MTSRTIHLTLHDWDAQSLAAPATGDAIHLIDLDYTSHADGSADIVVRGLSFGATGVSVSLASDGSVASVAVTPVANRFVARISLSAIATTSLVVEASHTDPGSTGRDRAILALEAGRIVVPAHPTRSVDPAVLDYAAGTPDRLQLSRTFVKLDPQPRWIRKLSRLALGSDASGYASVDGAAAQKAADKEIETLRKSLERGELTPPQFERAVGERIRAIVSSQLKPVPKALAGVIKAQQVAWRAWRDRTLADEPKPETAGRKRARAAARQPSATGAMQSMMPPPRRDTRVVELPDGTGAGDLLEDLIRAEMAYWRAHLRLGVLFHERTRIRPTRQVLGEPFYQLALTPGEEVQIRQTSDTRRKTSLQDLREDEEETEASFSSTWSTDMGSTISSENSFQQSTNIGAGVSGSVPEVPVNVSADVAASTTQAESSSSQGTVAMRREKTTTTTARMRQQHRIQIELAAEDNRSLGTTRTLRNPNPLRTVMHTFHKVYRKEQFTLERFGAQLCLRITVEDPARTTRAAFLAGLGKIDPHEAAVRNVLAPVGVLEETFEFTVNAPADDGGLFHGTVVDRVRTRSHDLRAETGVGDDFVLTEPPRYVMTHCGIAFYGDANLQPVAGAGNADPDRVADWERSEAVPNVFVGHAFTRNGGSVRWETAPEPGAAVARASLRINQPLTYTAPTSLLGEKQSEIWYVRFRVETRWGPSDNALNDYRLAVQTERLRLSAMFSTDPVHALHEIATRDYPSSVVDRALGEGLTYPTGFEYRQVKEIFDLEGVVIDNVPYWVSPGTRSEADNLALRLQRLPAQLELNRLLTDELTAAQAIVYLPIRRGKEALALSLLPEAAGVAQAVADDFTRFHESRYGALAQPALPDIGAHMGPSPPQATAPGATQWAHAWEAPQARFDILGQWSELVPTDGVHIESHLAVGVVTDEVEAARHSHPRTEA